MLWVPAAASVPLQPPVAVQALALLELQLSVAALPLATAVGLAVKVTVGTGRVAGLGFAGLETPPQAASSSAVARVTHRIDLTV